ncbi:MAG: NTP transferase domain-containing protein [Candidatus Omnitrophota bacterium]
MKNNLAVVILAAGKGERMKSDIPKVMHPLCGRPMIGYILDLAKELKASKIVAVLGHKHQQIKPFLSVRVKPVIQKKLLGTADAVKTALTQLKGFSGTVLVLYADNPLLKKETVAKLLKYHRENNLAATLLTAQVEKPAGYGRILRDKRASIRGIVEEKDADDFEKDIKEINTGIICFNKKALEQGLRLVRPNNRKKEYYLTDLVSILAQKEFLVDAVKLDDINEALGINARPDLAKANNLMQQRINDGYMRKGVTIIDPATTLIAFGAKIGRDSLIYPFTVIASDVIIGKHCSIGPFAHLREGTRLEDGVLLGNFVEVVRSKISRNTWAKHFSYIGDSRIGRQVNIGAGTVTANFDGVKKHLTVIKDNAFIGSDTVLVAPVNIGRKATTGAGAVVLAGSKVKDNTVVAGIPAKLLAKKR